MDAQKSVALRKVEFGGVSFGDLKTADEKHQAWLYLMAKLTELHGWFAVQNKMDNDALGNLVNLIIQEHPSLTMEDVAVFVNAVKVGKLHAHVAKNVPGGKTVTERETVVNFPELYNRLDGRQIMDWLEMYMEARDGEQFRYQEQERQIAQAHKRLALNAPAVQQPPPTAAEREEQQWQNLKKQLDAMSLPTYSLWRANNYLRHSFAMRERLKTYHAERTGESIGGST